MEKIIKGKVFVLSNNIDTDQIIPAEHLVYSLSNQEESKKYGQFALSGVPPSQSGLPNGNIHFVNEGNYSSEYQIIIGGANFGCGSSREHAPFALMKAGVKLVIAESYARIFYRNSVDGGFLIPLEAYDKIFDKFITGEEVEVNLNTFTVSKLNSKIEFRLKPLGSVLPIIEAGGIFEFARLNNMI